MQKFLFSLPLFALLSFTLPAQHAPGSNVTTGKGVNVADHMLIIESKRASAPSEAYVEGSPYIENEFEAAFIRTTKETITSIPARYNTYADNLEYQLRGVTYVVNPSPNIQIVRFSSYSLVVDILTSRDDSYAFFIQLDSGRASLLKRQPMIFREAEAPKALAGDGKPATYVSTKDEYYLKVDKGTPKRVTNVKKMIESLPDHQKEVEDYASSNKLGRKPEDLVKLIQYYNSL